MKKSKGFTLVELVIVIAVIAILAGVMIGVFAGVVKSAKESAKLQELKNQEIAQKAEDILAKVDNANWLGWEDLETKLASAVSDAISKSGGTIGADTMKTVITEAVDAAIAKYASSIGTGNTGLTEEQVKFIVENAVSGKSTLTETQVKSIVNSAVAGLGTSTITKSQVQSIVENVVTAAQAKNLTLAQVTTAVNNAVTASTTDVNETIAALQAELTRVVTTYKDAVLTEEEIATLFAKYVSNGTVKGDYNWYDAGATTMTIGSGTAEAADELTALAMLSKGGETFEGKTITIAANVAIAPGAEWTPIGQGSYASEGFCGTIDGGGNTISGIKIDVIHKTAEGRNGYSTIYTTEASVIKDKVGYGFVDYLGVGGVVKNLNLVYELDFADPMNRYTYFGGVVGVLDGGTIENCKVSGTIKGYNRIGGLVGIMTGGTIRDCDVSGITNINVKLTSAETDFASRSDYVVGATLVAYIQSNLSTNNTGVCVIENCTVPKDGNSVVTSENYQGHIGYVTSNLETDPLNLTIQLNTKEGSNNAVAKDSYSVIYNDDNKTSERETEITFADVYTKLPVVGTTLTKSATPATVDEAELTITKYHS